MCGIAGIIGRSNFVQEPILKILARNLAHRGPDDEGIEIMPVSSSSDFSLGFVHRRLSIIDLSSAAHQPMLDEETGNWIVYNGEIYNFKDIKAELESKGYRFKSNSDTETILKAYSVYGVDCLKKLTGMFAFAIWDEKKKRFFLAVDHFGIKPLYFYRGENGLFLFSSEVRTLLKSGLIKKEVNPLAVDSFLAYGAIQASLTMIKGVYSLLPAHYLVYEFKNSSTHIVPYWSPIHALSDEPLVKEEEAIRELHDILVSSIQKHLVSDVPVGLFLSGGIDSSSVVALANKLKGGTLQSFSVTFPESTFSEEKYSRLIAGRYCKNHTEIKISQEDLLNLLPQAISAIDQPTIDGINVYVISKVVKESGIKTVLSGQGGDEVFGGYSTFERVPFIQRIYGFIKPLPLYLRGKIGEITDGFTRRSTVRSKVSQILECDGSIFSLYLVLRQLFNPKTRKYLIEKEYDREIVNGIPLQVAESLINEIKELDAFNKVSLLELRLYLANTLLRDGDFMSMAHGLEVRVPFLNHKLVEFVFKVSAKMKLQHNLPKPLLVNAMGDLLPKEIYLRPKMGFTFPWETWLRGRLRSPVEELLNDFPSNNEIGLNAKKCQNFWNMFLANKREITWPRVWAIYILLNWYRENISNR